jgi:hypothetical protein
VARFIHDREWLPWAGSLRLLGDAGALAQRELLPNQSEVPLRIAVTEPTFSAHFDRLEELYQGVDERDLTKIESIGIEIGDFSGPEGVRISGSVRGGLRVRVASADRPFGAGLLDQLSRHLEPRQRLQAPRIIRLLNFESVAGFLVAVGSFLGADLALKYVLGIEPLAARFALAGALGLAAWIALCVLGSASSPFELLRVDEPPRYQRRRTRVWNLLGKVALGVIASIVAAAIIGH